MNAAPSTGTTQLLAALSSGDEGAAAKLLPLVYAELRDIASRFLRREKPGHTLQATALVHEAYLKLVDRTQVDWLGRTHFKATAARAMRQVLIDHARRKRQVKHGARAPLTTLDESVAAIEVPIDDLIALGEAIDRLAAADPLAGRVIELRYFSDLTVPEVAIVLGVSERQVFKQSAWAKAWLLRELGPPTRRS